jgi:hypothetical protein
MAIAMTVGATKIKMLQENALASITKERSSRSKGTGGGDTLPESEVCSA